MEIESYKLPGPCSYEPTAMVLACTRPMQSQAENKKQKQTHKPKTSMELGKWAADPSLKEKNIGS